MIDDVIQGSRHDDNGVFASRELEELCDQILETCQSSLFPVVIPRRPLVKRSQSNARVPFSNHSCLTSVQ